MGPQDKLPVFQVSDLVSVVNQTLEYAYPLAVVEGEVASFKVSKGKYVFFDLKDDDASLGCFMMVYSLRQPLEDGMRIRVLTAPRLTPWGKFSLNVREIIPVGEGSIKRAFEILKNKLAVEGLFDVDRKRSLPHMPQRVGVVASVESAGYADFIKIVGQRWGGLDITVADVQVQGMGAAQQIIDAIEYSNSQAALPDVLVIVRGGGSADDLAVFNDEHLVRAVAASRVPTLVGVGHEVDVSLCDLAADVRAATPSNAAELLVPDRRAFLAELGQRQRLLAEKMAGRVTETRRTVEAANQCMLDKMTNNVANMQRRLHHQEEILRHLDPRAVLRRGYALVHDAQGSLVRGTADNITAGDELTVRTSCAILKVGVKDVQIPPKNISE